MQPPKKSFITHLGNLFLLKEASIKAIKQNKDYNRFGIFLFIVAIFLIFLWDVMTIAPFGILSVGEAFEFMQDLGLAFVFIFFLFSFLPALLYLCILHYIGTRLFSAKVSFLSFLKPMSAVIIYYLLFVITFFSIADNSKASLSIVSHLYLLVDVWAIIALVKVYNIVYKVKTGNTIAAYLITIVLAYLIDLIILQPLIGLLF